MKRCSKCRVEKDEREFYKNKTTKDGLQSQCKACQKADQASSKWKEYQKERYHSKYKDDPTFRERRLISTKRWKKRIKQEVFDHYGIECVICGYNKDIRALTIDHIDNDGAQHRKTMKGESEICPWLKRNDYPDGFQVLCRNCNWIKYCEHKGR